MNTKMRMLSFLLCFVMLVGLMPTTAFAANNFVDFLTTDINVEFAETGESGFYRVNLFGNGKAMKLPLVYRTDDLNLKFDGWYTAKVGGEKVTEETVFNGYTILYDRWTEANIANEKIITAIEIPNSALVNGYTENDYINASGTLSLAGVVSGKNYAVYNGLNAYGSQVTGAETIDTSNDYSVVTTVKLEDGYYFAPNISLTAQHGVRAGITYRAVGVTTNTWNSLATTVDICINFPAGGNNVGFITEPVGGTVNENEPYNFTWEVSGQPTAAELQMKNGSEWAKVDDLNINQTNGTISAQTGTKTYRILVTYGNSGSIYCNEFTVTWLAAVQNTFSMSPASGTVKNGTDYYYTWACVQTPATANLERKTGADWTSPEDLGTATSRTITYNDTYANSTQTFRVKATMAGGSAFYSNEFTVTYKATPLFSVQPADGKVAIGETYTVKYTVDKADGDGEFDGNNSVLQKKNGGNWDNVSTPVYAAQTVVPAQDSAMTETYRVGIKIGSNELLYSEEFTVQWIDDYTFELDQNSLAWGSIAKSDYYGEYAKMIKIMHTGTKTGTLKYDTPTNFYVQYWHGPYYDTLTFTPKTDITAGTHNESVNVWVSSNGSDVLEQKTVSLSITIEAPTYTVSFDKNGGSGSMASVYNVSGSYELPTCTFTAPDGKEFRIWQVNGGEEKNAGETITVTSNTTLTALWKDLPVVSGYTITFEAGEGSGTMNPVAGASGIYHLPACTFTAPSGKQFKAWQVGNQELQPGQTITVSANTTVTALWVDIPVNNYTVYFSSANVCGVSGSYNTTQYVEQGQAMTDIIVTANDGYYFADPLNGTLSSNGVTATRNSYTQVTISGTPSANVSIQFGPNTKQKEATPTNLYFEATGADTGNLCNLENGVTYSVTGAATAEFTATNSTYALTNVTEGTLNVVKKASNPDTKLDSDAYGYTVGKNNSVPNLYSTNCSDANNNNGQIWNVTAEMEYQKEGDNVWIPGTGSNITGLTPGTYYVRYKASSINLASNAQTINIAAYGLAQLTGTVEITGDVKYGSTLTANVTNSNNTGDLSYQWVRNTSNISGATGENYTLVEADIGNTIKVVVTSSIESGSITSDATAIVEKADGPAAPSVTPVACTNGSNNDGKITGVTTAMEYSAASDFASKTACTGTEITNLTNGTYYVRIAETATHKAGAVAIVVVPAYSAPTFTVSFDANGGTGTMADVTGVSGEYTLPANGFTAPAGKQFKAWSVNGVEKAVGETIIVNANTTVKAIWENIPIATYTVSFDANGGTGTMADVTGVSGEYTLPANGFTAPTGKQFKAWSVNGVEKAAGETIIVNANTTVKAIWENIPIATYTVSFDANGGTGTMADVTGVSGEYTLPANGFTAPAGKQFKAWSVNGVEKAVGSKITVTADITVKAVWENIVVEKVKSPQISPNGGTFTGSQTVTITCATEEATIYYTTNGTAPSTSSTKYTTAFTISTTTTVKAIAVKNGMVDSDVVTATFTKKSSGGGGGGGPSKPVNPTEKLPAIDGKTMSWNEMVNYINKAVKNEFVVDLNTLTEVPVEVVKAIADRDSKVTFVVDAVFKWVVDGSAITTPVKADMTFVKIASQRSDGLRGIEGTQFKINDTGIPTSLEIAFKATHAGKFANLYKSENGKLVFAECAKISADGKVTLSNVKDKGNYIVMLCEFSDRPGDMNNDGVMNAMDASAILKDIVGLEPGKNPLVADFNGDGKVNAMDASAILKRIVGLT